MMKDDTDCYVNRSLVRMIMMARNDELGLRAVDELTIYTASDFAVQAAAPGAPSDRQFNADLRHDAQPQSPLGTLQGVSEDDLARVLYEAEYCGETYPWEKQLSTEQLTYKSQAEAALRKFVIRHPDTRPDRKCK